MIWKIHLNKNSLWEYRKNMLIYWYCIIEDFIDNDFYACIETELTKNTIHVAQTHINKTKKTKDIYVAGENLFKLHNFFQSNAFLNFLSLIYNTKVDRKNYIDFLEVFPEYHPKWWIVGQLYDEWCFFDWHTDGHHNDEKLGAFTYYLYNDDIDWKKDFWWCLDLGEKIIIPKRNSLVLIKSDLKHRVTKVKAHKKRLSLQSVLINNPN